MEQSLLRSAWGRRRLRRAAPLLAAAVLAAVSGAALRCAAIFGSSAKARTAAVIFDCDGTLVDSETMYFLAFNRAVERLRGKGAWDVPLLNNDDWGANCSGRGLEYDSRLAVEHFGLNGTTPAEFLVRWKHEFHLLTKKPGDLALMAGFDALYTHARSLGLKVAVASSSDRKGLEMKLRNGVLANSKVVKSLDDFDVIVCSEDVKRDKPNPEIYLTAAARLGVTPKSCWVVEDTMTGVLAGKRAGMHVAAVPNAFTRSTNDFSTADIVLDNMTQVIPLLRAAL
mmetsp:Transcript_67715/g.177590  ORF Transcript_67715/g.177590 Transcript_67715/m.177590 type:complete len:283 (-) Transcript_67715:16-864(-)